MVADQEVSHFNDRGGGWGKKYPNFLLLFYSDIQMLDINFHQNRTIHTDFQIYLVSTIHVIGGWHNFDLIQGVVGG